MRSEFKGALLAASIASMTAVADAAQQHASSAFRGKSPEEVVNMLSASCMARDFTVSDQSAFSVTCEAPMTTGQEVLARVFVGNAYSTKPQRFVRFNVVKVEIGARAQATEWIETTMPSGQKNTVQLDAKKHVDEIQAWLESLGGTDQYGITPGFEP